MDWHGIKSLTVEMTGISRDALHVLAGFGGQFFIALLVKRPLSSWLPWSLMLIATVTNELYDFTYDGGLYLPMWPEAAHDVWLTMAMPTTIFVLARWAPGLIVNSHGRAPSARLRPAEKSSHSGRLATRSMEALAELNEALLQMRNDGVRQSQRRSRGKSFVLLGWRVDVFFVSALVALGVLVVLAIALLR